MCPKRSMAGGPPLKKLCTEVGRGLPQWGDEGAVDAAATPPSYARPPLSR